MDAIRILIPHNTPPKMHDLMTEQCRNICKKLAEKQDLQTIWVMFPPERVTNSKDPTLIDSHNYRDTVELIEDVNPDFVIINGSMDFLNIEMALATKYKKIPLVVLFFRNVPKIGAVTKFQALKSRYRSIFSDKTIAIHEANPKNSRMELIGFQYEQLGYLLRTLKKINLNLLQRTKFVLYYLKSVMFEYFPINKTISGTINLCSKTDWVQKLTNIGFNKSAIFLVGDPYFDSLYSKSIIQHKTSKNLGDKIQVLFCPSTVYGHGLCSKQDEYNLIINTVNEILKHDKFEVAIKMHPSSASRAEYEEKILKKLHAHVILYQKEDLVNLTNQCDVMISYGGSGAMLYGVLLKKSVVNLDFNIDATGNNPWPIDKIFVQCKNLDLLPSKILEAKNKIVPKQDYEEFIKERIGKFDGECAKRAADLIFRLLNQ